ncbi:MAG: hypothetical protein AAF243_00120 [Cyanobacteria bacterium P01_A01_bin.137]
MELSLLTNLNLEKQRLRLLRSLQQLGCQLGQGYFFSPPCTAADIEAMFLQK